MKEIKYIILYLVPVPLVKKLRFLRFRSTTLLFLNVAPTITDFKLPSSNYVRIASVCFVTHSALVPSRPYIKSTGNQSFGSRFNNVTYLVTTSPDPGFWWPKIGNISKGKIILYFCIINYNLLILRPTSRWPSVRFSIPWIFLFFTP